MRLRDLSFRWTTADFTVGEDEGEEGKEENEAGEEESDKGGRLHLFPR